MKVGRTSQGFALLVFLIVLIGIGAFGLSKLLSSSVEDSQEMSQKKTRQALSRAKEALLSYAVNFLIKNDYAKMGRLPCPDSINTLNSEGYQDPSCGAYENNHLGLLPFKTLGLGKLEDGNGLCLWYAISGSYKNSPDLIMVNWDTAGSLNIEDENGILQHPNSLADYPLAAVIAAGAPLAGQDRSPDGSLPLCAANHNPDNYLEGGSRPVNPTGSIWTFVDASLSSRLSNAVANDQIVYITRRELWERIKKTRELDTADPSSAISTLTRQLADCLVAYSDHPNNPEKRLPYASRVILDNYQDSNKYEDYLNRYSGRFPQNIQKSNHKGGFILDHDPEKAFVVQNGTTAGFCETQTGLNPDIWENWKDQFFYVVAKDYRPESTKSLADRCNDADSCLTIGGSTKVAAIVFFAQDRSSDQNRILDSFNDDNDELQRLAVWQQYLDGGNRHLYKGIASSGANQFDNTANDYAYCLFKQPAGNLSTGPC